MPFALVIPFVVFYSAIDAYRNAVMINLRAAGRPPEPEAEDDAESPAWGAVLLGIGLLLLMNNLGILQLMAVRRLWPLVLIVARVRVPPPRDEAARSRRARAEDGRWPSRISRRPSSPGFP